MQEQTGDLKQPHSSPQPPILYVPQEKCVTAVARPGNASWCCWGTWSSPVPSPKGHRQSPPSPSVFIHQDTLLFMSKANDLLSTKEESLNRRQPPSFGELPAEGHGNLVVLCFWAGTKRMLGKPDCAGHSCQTHSSGERSYGQWPSVLVWPRQIHSCSLFRLSKQDPARLWFVDINSARLTSSWLCMLFGHSKAETPK